MNNIVLSVRLMIDLVVVLTVAVSALIALAGMIRMGLANPDSIAGWDRIWQRFAVGISFALAFSLVSDILETLIVSGWESIARLASIAAIFLLLNPYVVRKFQRPRSRRRPSGA